MPVYAVAYGSHEDSDIVYVSHDEKYTYEEFEEISVEAITELLKRVKSGDIDLPIKADREWPFLWQAAELFPEVIELAMEEAGFQVVKPAMCVTLSGWQDLFYQETKWCSSDGPTAKLIQKLKEAGFTEDDSASYAYKKKEGRLNPSDNHTDTA